MDFITSQVRNPRTQQLLAKKLSIHQDTLSDWKNRPGFWDQVKTERASWGKEKTPDVINALYKKILSDADPARIKLWFQFIENWTEKTVEVPFRVNVDEDREKYGG